MICIYTYDNSIRIQCRSRSTVVCTEYYLALAVAVDGVDVEIESMIMIARAR